MEAVEQEYVVVENVRSSLHVSKRMRVFVHHCRTVLVHGHRTGCGEVVDDPTLQNSLHNVPLNIVVLFDSRLQHFHILLRQLDRANLLRIKDVLHHLE